MRVIFTARAMNCGSLRPAARRGTTVGARIMAKTMSTIRMLPNTVKILENVVPSRVFLVIGQVARKNGDKGHRQETAGQNMIEYFRQHESHPIGIHRRAGARQCGQYHLSGNAGDTA